MVSCPVISIASGLKDIAFSSAGPDGPIVDGYGARQDGCEKLSDLPSALGGARVCFGRLRNMPRVRLRERRVRERIIRKLRFRARFPNLSELPARAAGQSTESSSKNEHKM